MRELKALQEGAALPRGARKRYMYI